MINLADRGKVTYHAGFLGPWIIDNSGYPRQITIKGKTYTAKTYQDVAKIKQAVEDEAAEKKRLAALAKISHTIGVQNEALRKAQARVKQIPELTLSAYNPLLQNRQKQTLE